MRNREFIRVAVFALVLGGTVAAAEDVGHYREFELGSAVAAVSTVTGATSELKVMITDESVAALARTAAARAVVLDACEAPQREAAREKKEAEDRRAADENARLTNKPIFRP